MLCTLYDETLEQLLLSQEILILVFIKQQGVDAAGEQLQKSESFYLPQHCLISVILIIMKDGVHGTYIWPDCLFLSYRTNFFKHIYVIHKKPDTQEP